MSVDTGAREPQREPSGSADKSARAGAAESRTSADLFWVVYEALRLCPAKVGFGDDRRWVAADAFAAADELARREAALTREVERLAAGVGEARPAESAVRQNDTVPGLRQCPHGVNVGPLDDYKRGPDDLVTSSYCDICNRAWALRGHDGYVTEADIAKAEAERVQP